MSTPADRLAAAVPATRVGPGHPGGGPDILRVGDDTRRTQPGELFLLRGGGAAGGLERLAEAASRGAVAAVLPAGTDPAAAAATAPGLTLFCPPPGVPLDQAAAGRVADAFHGSPASALTLVGVTGTNGKTTVATITQHLLSALGLRSGLLGTVAVDTGGGGPVPAQLTTPGAIELRERFAEMRGNGCRAAAMEVSSHALDQGRTAGLLFGVGVFTNLSQDHLDYHGTMEAYAAAKARLFAQLGTDAVAVVNAEDPRSADVVAGVPPERVVHTRLGGAARGPGVEAVAEVLSLGATSATARFEGPFGSFEGRLCTGGRHNVSNALQAVVAAHAVAERLAPGVATPGELARALASAPPVPGRLEPVAAPAGVDPAGLPSVLVDYAHTPDALARVLAALRPVTAGRLVCVYGCGGDRDRAKRPLMTAAALGGADSAVLTSDNPRTEDPDRILADASAGAGPADRNRLRVLADRRAAICAAVAAAAPGDTVLIAGKGHESDQIVADGRGGVRRLHFDDREEAAQALRLPDR